MLEMLYPGSCDFKQESGLEVAHASTGDQQKEKKNEQTLGICGTCVSSRAEE